MRWRPGPPPWSTVMETCDVSYINFIDLHMMIKAMFIVEKLENIPKYKH